jgi:hypothetical protein
LISNGKAWNEGITKTVYTKSDKKEILAEMIDEKGGLIGSRWVDDHHGFSTQDH